MDCKDITAIFIVYLYNLFSYVKVPKKAIDKDFDILAGIYNKLEANEKVLQSIENKVSKLLEVTCPPSIEWVDGTYMMKRLGITQRTLYSYRQKGILPYSQIGGIHYYKTSDIDAVLEYHYIKGKR